MSLVNENFLRLKESYVFPKIAAEVKKFQEKNPDRKVIKLGVGDVTRPIPEVCSRAMIKAVKDLTHSETFHGYGPEIGYSFLKEKIAKWDYEENGIKVSADEIFISDGINSDIGNIVDLFDINNKVGILDPVYPAYVESNVIAGRGGRYVETKHEYEEFYRMPCTEENHFIPELPKEKVDLIYLCFPNNPTGAVLKKKELEQWVRYAKEENSILLFDGAYEAFITEEDVPHSIYEIEGAREVAIEFKSFSKNAGFTGVRCGYTVVPKDLKAFTKKHNPIALNPLWERRQCTKFNGASYLSQKGAEAIYTMEGQKEMKENILYYQENARLIKSGMKQAGFKVYGGENAPYLWIKLKQGVKSWEFFYELLENAAVVGTPGVGFGASGEGYFRLTAFGQREEILEAMRRIGEIDFKKI